MPKKPEKPAERDSVAREVDRLLRQLPGADPTLKGDPDAPLQSSTPRPQMMGPRPAGPRPAGPPPPEPIEVWGVWGRLVGTVALGVALTQWPYRSACGWPLYGYLAAVAAVLVAAGWTATAAWRFRMAAAHALALIAAFWGVVLAAEQILPRVGYAAETGYWQCESLRAAQAVAAARTVVPPIVVPTPVTDSATADSASAATPVQPQSVSRER